MILMRRKIISFSFAFAAIMTAACLVTAPRTAKAADPECAFCACIAIQQITEQGVTGSTSGMVLRDITAGWEDMKKWMVDDLYKESLGKDLGAAINQAVTTMSFQAASIGAMMDVQNTIKSQTLLNKLSAQAQKDYKTSTGMCTIGTAARSLASSHAKADLAAASLSRRAIDRQVSAGNTLAMSPGSDKENRLAHFSKRFCTAADNNPTRNRDTGLSLLCDSAQSAANAKTANADIDFMKTVLSPRTIAADIEGTSPTDARESVLALSANLYGHDIVQGFTGALLTYRDNMDEFLDFRSVMAKRSVAQNSYNAIVGLKSPGSTDTGTHIAAILTELGVPSREIKAYLSDEDGRPGYLAQMEILAKKIYQSPSFYVSLYESPANLKRRSVAMQAIKSMLGRDIHESYLRSEAIMAVLLESKLIPAQTLAESQAGTVAP